MPCFFKKMGWQSLLHGKGNLNIDYWHVRWGEVKPGNHNFSQHRKGSNCFHISLFKIMCNFYSYCLIGCNVFDTSICERLWLIQKSPNIACSMSQTVTNRRNKNVVPYLGSENRTYPWSWILIYEAWPRIKTLFLFNDFILYLEIIHTYSWLVDVVMINNNRIIV